MKLEEVGMIDVDAGIVQIGDPCYWYGKGHDFTYEVGWTNYCNLLTGEKVHIIRHDHGREGRAITVQSGYGDGSYPVYIVRSDAGLPLALVTLFACSLDELAATIKEAK